MKKDPISETQKKLNNLKVKKCIEKTNVYDDEIKKLSDKLDWIFWGIKQKI